MIKNIFHLFYVHIMCIIPCKFFFKQHLTTIIWCRDWRLLLKINLFIYLFILSKMYPEIIINRKKLSRHTLREWLLLEKLKFGGWLIEISGVQNSFYNFDTTPQSGEITVFGFFPMRHRTYLYIIHDPLCELEFSFTIKKSSMWFRCSPIPDIAY